MTEVRCPYCPKDIRTNNKRLAHGILMGSLAHHIKAMHPDLWRGSITKTLEAHPPNEEHRKVCKLCEAKIEPPTIDEMSRHLADVHPNFANLGTFDTLRMFADSR